MIYNNQSIFGRNVIPFSLGIKVVVFPRERHGDFPPSPKVAKSKKMRNFRKLDEKNFS